MTIEDVFQRQDLRLENTEKWIVVEDDWEKFRKALHTDRIGKHTGTKFYGKLAELDPRIRHLIAKIGGTVEYIASASERSTQFPGFDQSKVTTASLLSFAEQLRSEIEPWVQE